MHLHFPGTFPIKARTAISIHNMYAYFVFTNVVFFTASTSCFLSGGPIVPPHISSAVISEVGVSGRECVVTVSWSEPVISCNGSTSQYVLTVSPNTTECSSGSCEVGRGEERFEKRELNVTLTVEQMYNFTVRADTCNNNQTGQDSEQFTIQMEGNEVICSF